MKEFEGNPGGSQASVSRVGAILAAVVLSAVVIFSLGVMVGKRVTGGSPVSLEPPQALPTETLVPPAPGPADQPAAGQTAGGEEGEGKLTFFKTLGEEAPPPVLPQKAPEPPPAPPAREEKGGEEAAARAPEPPPAPPKTASLPPAEQVKSLFGSGKYYVQLSSTTNRQWADDLVRRLGKKGLPSNSLPVTIKGTRWYRIRVGSFPDREAANKAQGILKKSMDLDGMVVTGD